jgi:hypothetical protein
MARLTAAMQQHHWRSGLAVDVGGQFISRRANKDRSSGHVM